MIILNNCLFCCEKCFKRKVGQLCVHYDALPLNSVHRVSVTINHRKGDTVSSISGQYRLAIKDLPTVKKINDISIHSDSEFLFHKDLKFDPTKKAGTVAIELEDSTPIKACINHTHVDNLRNGDTSNPPANPSASHVLTQKFPKFKDSKASTPSVSKRPLSQTAKLENEGSIFKKIGTSQDHQRENDSQMDVDGSETNAGPAPSGSVSPMHNREEASASKDRGTREHNSGPTGSNDIPPDVLESALKAQRHVMKMTENLTPGTAGFKEAFHKHFERGVYGLEGDEDDETTS